jgi:hypothetical protein
MTDSRKELAGTFYAAHGFTRLPMESLTYALDLVKFAHVAR